MNRRGFFERCVLGSLAVVSSLLVRQERSESEPVFVVDDQREHLVFRDVGHDADYHRQVGFHYHRTPEGPELVDVSYWINGVRIA